MSFRLSEDEYDELRTLSAAGGGRSISDFARSAVRRLIADGMRLPCEALDAKVRELCGKTEEIERDVRRLVRLVEPAGSPS